MSKKPECPDCGLPLGRLPGSVQTAMAYSPFVDHDGNTHLHDGNKIGFVYQCANRHDHRGGQDGTPCRVTGCAYQPEPYLVAP